MDSSPEDLTKNSQTCDGCGRLIHCPPTPERLGAIQDLILSPNNKRARAIVYFSRRCQTCLDHEKQEAQSYEDDKNYKPVTKEGKDMDAKRRERARLSTAGEAASRGTVASSSNAYAASSFWAPPASGTGQSNPQAEGTLGFDAAHPYLVDAPEPTSQSSQDVVMLDAYAPGSEQNRFDQT